MPEEFQNDHTKEKAEWLSGLLQRLRDMVLQENTHQLPLRLCRNPAYTQPSIDSKVSQSTRTLDKKINDMSYEFDE